MTDLPDWEPIARWLAAVGDCAAADFEAEAKACAYEQALEATDDTGSNADFKPPRRIGTPDVTDGFGITDGTETEPLFDFTRDPPFGPTRGESE
jgi:hypothetical protein